MEVTKVIRHRINISRGMKGAVSYEATVDMEGFPMEEVLAESAKLVAALDAKYPPPVEGKP